MSYRQAMTCDCIPGFFEIDGSMGVFELEAGNLHECNNIRTDLGWQVRFEWTQKGANTDDYPAHKWMIHLYLERMGSGEWDFPSTVPHTKDVPHVLASGHHYGPANDPIYIEIPAGVVPVGTYKLVATLRLVHAQSNNPVPVVAYGEGPILQFYSV